MKFKYFLQALAVIVFGYTLLNLVFLADYIYHQAVLFVVTLFIKEDLMGNVTWFPYVLHFSFMVIIGFISIKVFRSKMKILLKAIYMTVPMAVVLVTLGILFYPWPYAQVILGAVFAFGVLFYLYKTRQPWIYYYTVVLVTLTLAVFTLMGGEI